MMNNGLEKLIGRHGFTPSNLVDNLLNFNNAPSNMMIASRLIEQLRGINRILQAASEACKAFITMGNRNSHGLMNPLYLLFNQISTTSIRCTIENVQTSISSCIGSLATFIRIGGTTSVDRNREFGNAVRRYREMCEEITQHGSVFRRIIIAFIAYRVIELSENVNESVGTLNPLFGNVLGSLDDVELLNMFETAGANTTAEFDIPRLLYFTAYSIMAASLQILGGRLFLKMFDGEPKLSETVIAALIERFDMDPQLIADDIIAFMTAVQGAVPAIPHDAILDTLLATAQATTPTTDPVPIGAPEIVAFDNLYDTILALAPSTTKTTLIDLYKAMIKNTILEFGIGAGLILFVNFIQSETTTSHGWLFTILTSNVPILFKLLYRLFFVEPNSINFGTHLVLGGWGELMGLVGTNILQDLPDDI